MNISKCMPHLNDEIKLLTMSEAARLLGISKRHLENLRTKGHLRVVKLGSCIRVRPEDLRKMQGDLLSQ